MKRTTKACWNCDSKVLRHFSSLNEKVCHACGTVMPWVLEDGQKPMLGTSRDGEPVNRVINDSPQPRRK
ncbi:hypothetical protein VRRI112168_02635 [Vreelandella rituensis]|uniref:Uncharacterized protein n=1 Tax=Vreelandella rituensis TaxID=2282306 RepID=A0A368U9Q2_9GAMM|nr:hypothetical protein [Halomonas rituensis]RCV93641.1 hypothetical protein DU506_00355 [Halomonas rituensis]